MNSIVFKPDEPTPTNETRESQWEQRFNLVRGEDASPIPEAL